MPHTPKPHIYYSKNYIVQNFPHVWAKFVFFSENRIFLKNEELEFV